MVEPSARLIRVFSDRRLLDARLIARELDAGGATRLNKQVREDRGRLLVRPIPLQLAQDLEPGRGAPPALHRAMQRRLAGLY